MGAEVDGDELGWVNSAVKFRRGALCANLDLDTILEDGVLK